MSFEQTVMPEAVDVSQLGNYINVRTMHVMDRNQSSGGLAVKSLSRLIAADLNNDVTVGADPSGSYKTFQIRRRVNNKPGMTMLRPLIKKALDADDHIQFSKGVYDLMMMMVSPGFLESGSENDSKIPNGTVQMFFDSLKVKPTDDGSVIWSNILKNIDNINCDESQIDVYGNIYDLKTYFLRDICLRYGVNVYIPEVFMKYSELMYYDSSINTRYHISVRGGFFNSLQMFKVLGGERKYDGLLDSLYKMVEVDSTVTVDEKQYKVKALNISDKFGRDTVQLTDNDSILSLPVADSIEERNYTYGKSALRHKARYMCMKMAIATNNVQMFNALIDSDNRVSSSTVEYYSYDLEGVDDRIGNISGVSYTYLSEIVRQQVIERNTKDTDILWMNRFVKWYTILNAISSALGVASLFQALFTTRDKKNDEVVIDKDVPTEVATDAR